MRTTPIRTLVLPLLSLGCATIIGADFDDLRRASPCENCSGLGGGAGTSGAIIGAGDSGSGLTSNGGSQGGTGAEGGGSGGTDNSGGIDNSGGAGRRGGDEPASGGASPAGGSSTNGGAGGTQGDGGDSGDEQDGGEWGGAGQAAAGMGVGGGGDSGAAGGGAGGVAGQGGTDPPVPLGGPVPGEPSPIGYVESPALGYYTPIGNIGHLCPDLRPSAVECGVYGFWGSEPYAIDAPPPCVAGDPTPRFASFGTVFGNGWYPSLNNYVWEWEPDNDDNIFFLVDPSPASWNGVLIAYESGAFAVDWERSLWAGPYLGVAFRPTFVGAGTVYPVVGRWRREYGERLGLFHNGTFYVDWNGDNAWDANLDRSFSFGIGKYPVAADFNPGGDDEIGTYENGTWYLDWNGNHTFDGVDGGDLEIVFGETDSIPVVARDGWRRDCE